MKQLLSLFLFLLPCLAWAQYPSNGNQKITLGEQTTADGLIWRGIAADTTTTVKSDTAAYFVLDTVNKKLYFYKVSAIPKWNEISGSGGGGVDSTAIKYVNTYGTQTINGAKTFTTAPTFSTALLGGSGGTGITTFGAANRIPYAASTTALTTSSALTFDATLGRLVVNGISAVSGGQSFIVNNSTPLALFTIANAGSITARGTGNIVFNSFSSGQNRYQLYSDGNTDNPLMFYIAGGAKGSSYGELSINADYNSNAFSGGGFLFDTRSGIPPVRITIKNVNVNPTDAVQFAVNGEIFMGYDYSEDKGAYRLQVKDSVYVGGNVSASAYTTRSDFNLKDDIFDIKYGLNDILKLQPVEYTYKSNGSKQLGFIAQDIGTILPEVVSFEESMSVNYQAIIPILTKAIQEQQALIKALEQRIINLENK
jgi:hypothetical protein